MSKNSIQYYAEVTAEDTCPECGHILVRNMWNEKKKVLFDECFNCGHIVERSIACACPE